MLNSEVLNELKTIVGAEDVLTAPEHLLTHAYDGTPLLRRKPEAVVIPDSTEEIVAIMKLANEADFKVVPRGSGTGLSGGSIPTENSIVLLLTRLNRLLEVDAANLTALAQAGVITGHLHAAVEAQGLFYPPDPGSKDISTLGGNVAENSGGLRGLKYGVTKDYVLGLEVVLPTGEVLWTGGKSVKDVAGYDLKHLFIGSEGTLGIFTQILVKLIPKPETKRTMLAYFDSVTDAGEAVSALIAAHVIPATLEFLDHTTIRCVEDFAHIGLPTDIAALLLIEVDGRKALVEEDAQRVMEVCRQHRAREFKIAATEEEGTQMAEARRVALAALARVRPTTILEDATVPRSEVPRMLAVIEETARKYQVQIGTFGHAGDGNLHPTFLTDERDEEEIARVHKAFDDIFAGAIALGGTITGEHGVGLAKRRFLPQQTGEVGIRLMQQLKGVLDPKNVLNPGKVIEPGTRLDELWEVRGGAKVLPFV